VKPNITSVEVHPQLSDIGHPVDVALVGASSLWGRLQGFVAAGTLVADTASPTTLFIYSFIHSIIN
jgi:hypothetical protein